MMRCTNLCLFGVIRIRFPALNDLQSILVQQVEIIRRVRHDVPLDAHEAQILENGVFELRLMAINDQRVGRAQQRLTRSLDGFVSSNRMIIFPWYMRAKYWFSVAALACPMCR